ncbi:MAG: DUF2508 family protein [Lachnospiraceae bacterium]|nr:DUF2508 family protein [Lachnospiraceae bacterium]
MKRNKKPTYEELRREELKQELEQVQAAMALAYSNLSNVVDPDLIDCYIFELNAMQKKHKFILKQVKDQCVSAEIVNR